MRSEVLPTAPSPGGERAVRLLDDNKPPKKKKRGSTPRITAQTWVELMGTNVVKINVPTTTHLTFCMAILLFFCYF
jgi:hypothetical protein